MERRDALTAKALDGRGKRAAFALFYGPLHFLTVREIARSLSLPKLSRVVDLGCGTGAAGAALALEAQARLDGVDSNAWAIQEARHTFTELGIQGQVRRGDLTRSDLPGEGGAVIAGWAVNELSEGARSALLPRFLACKASLLVVEPIARRPVPWWDDWAKTFREAGGRADEWRFRVELPGILARLDHAARLDHRELTARSLWRA